MKTISILVALTMSSCTLTVTPDGTRTWNLTASGEQISRAIQIISSK